MNLIQTLSLLIGIIINLFILMSYSTFTKDDYCDKNNSRINCPYFTYSSGKNKLERTRGTFRALGYVHLILTMLQTLDIFISYRTKKGIVIICDYLVGAIIISIYSIFTLILVFKYNKPIYPFLYDMTLLKAIGEFILFQIGIKN